MDLAIEPIVYPKLATRVKIDVTVLLGDKAIVRVSFYEADNEYQPIDIKLFYIEGDEYKAWGNDDTYLETLIYSKLGLTKSK
jgi:hypothetical protein